MKISGDRLIGEMEPPVRRPQKPTRVAGISELCGKAVYSDGRKARHVKNHIRKTRGTRLKTYYCAECCGWHLTKKGVK